MPDMVVCRAEQLATRDRQPSALDFTFGLGIAVGDIPNDPDNAFNNEIGAPIVKGVSEQDGEQHMEDDNNDANNDDSRETDEADYIDDGDNQFSNTYEGVLTTEPTGRVQTTEITGGVLLEEPPGTAYGRVLAEDVPLEEGKHDEEEPAAAVDPIEAPQGGPPERTARRNMEVPHCTR